jgi:hypothetical protein
MPTSSAVTAIRAIAGPSSSVFTGQEKSPIPIPSFIACARMEAAGLLRREPHPSDRRMVRLRLTSRGRDLEKAIDEEISQLTERALATLSTAEREALILTLQQIRRNLESR